MISRYVQQWVRQFMLRLMKPFARFPISPDVLTVIGFLFSIIAAVVIAEGQLVAGGMLVLLAGVFDMFDGAIARVRNASTPFGAFLDSVLDRYSEGIILLGLLLYVLQKPPSFHETLWPASHEQFWMIVLIYVTMVGSFSVSYTKARAESLSVECHVGLLARPERVVILAASLLSGTSIWGVALLAVFSNVTAIERIIAVRIAMSKSQRTSSHLPHENSQVSQTVHTPIE